MNNKTGVATLCAALMWPALAAASNGNFLDLYHVVDAEADATTGTADGDGFGIRSRLHIGDEKFLNFEYQDGELDPGQSEFRFLRLGYGGWIPLNHAIALMGNAEFVQSELGTETRKGFALRAGLEMQLMPRLTTSATVGIADLGLGNGSEANIGARFAITEQFSVFGDYRIHNLELDSGADLDLTELRLGVGYHFGHQRPPAPSKPAPAPRTAAAPPPPVAPAPLAPPPEPEVRSPEPMALAVGAVYDWARAWSAQDVDRYLAAYASNFKPAAGLSRAAWAKQRRQRVSAPSRIDVQVIDPVAVPTGDASARISFTQAYTSNTYSDRGTKVLEMEQQAGRWLIVREYSR